MVIKKIGIEVVIHTPDNENLSEVVIDTIIEIIKEKISNLTYEEQLLAINQIIRFLEVNGY